MVFERLESNVRGYCRSFPTVFESATGAEMVDTKGRRFIDFLSGAGTLNYGHNHPHLKACAIEYLGRNGVVHGLDMHTAAKRDFLEVFEEMILKPRELAYKAQFTGPTGTNAVEAALKLARRITGRTQIVAFTNGFHGMTLGSLSATANRKYRSAAGVPLGGVTHMPYAGYLGANTDTLAILEKYLQDPSSGLDQPAGILVETVQGEGGVNVASYDWLKRLSALCRRNEIPLIVDDIQVGNGRTGYFFSFEPAEVEPDIVVMSKSLSGLGLPMSLVLMKPELDLWRPGEHNGTFRGNNLAFVTASETIRTFWSDNRFEREVQRKGRLIRSRLEAIAQAYPDGGLSVRGRGMIQGLVFDERADKTDEVVASCFRQGLIIETSGAHGQVVKVLPPLVIDDAPLEQGILILKAAVAEVMATSGLDRLHDKNGEAR